MVLYEAGNVFRYELDLLTRKDTKFTYICNKKRFEQRRAPMPTHSLQQSFEANAFHFNKIQPNEILFVWPEDTSKPALDVIVNVSPIVENHILLVPDKEACLNQVMREDSLILALQFLQQMPNDFCLGYNSLLAFASVNHLHFHGWYNQEKLWVQTLTQHAFLPDVGEFYCLSEHPVDNVVVRCANAEHIVRSAHLMQSAIDACLVADIPHNLIIVFDDQHVMHLILFLRVAQHNKISYIEGGHFGIAVCELSGLIVNGHEEEYHRTQVEDVLCAMGDVKLPPERFLEFQSALRQLF